MKRFQEKLKPLKAQGRYRALSSASNGIDLTSNDYLGLAGSEYLRAAAAAFFEGGGAVGSAASRLLRGHHEEHLALEDFAAGYFAAERTLFFSSGFQANMALFQALPLRGDVVVFDGLIHASARGGIQASAAKRIKVRHNDLADFEAALKRARAQVSGDGHLWVAVESVYSMDGDSAPLVELYALAVLYDAILVIDEAHAIGVCGATGKGLSEGLVATHGYERILTLHTCGKALGVAGGLVCGHDDMIDYMVNAARGFIYSTAPMPVQAHLVRRALEFVASKEGAAAREALHWVCGVAQAKLGGAGSHVVPIILGADERAVYIARALQESGYDIRAVRPPSVPEGSARLRLSLNAGMEARMIDDFVAALGPLL